MPKTNKYSERIRKAMEDKGASLRDAAAGTNYSYEHIRMVMAGGLSVSEEFHQAICAYLGLDLMEMQRLLKEARFRAKWGEMELPTDDRLVVLWGKLTEEEQERLLRIAEGYIADREARPSGGQ